MCTGHDTRSSTCFNDIACCVYNISYDGSKYLRTIFVGSRVSRALARVRVRVLPMTKLSDDDDDGEEY